jgi:hypothetical protein
LAFIKTELTITENFCRLPTIEDDEKWLHMFAKIASLCKFKKDKIPDKFLNQVNEYDQKYFKEIFSREKGAYGMNKEKF